MSSGPLRALAFAAIAAAAVTTVCFVAYLRPTSAVAFAAFSAWLVSPHAAMAVALRLRERKDSAPASWHAIAILVSIGGLLVMADPIFWHIDPQGAIAVVMAPILQFIALAVLLPAAALLHALPSSHRRRP
jgi:hypothetical protein